MVLRRIRAAIAARGRRHNDTPTRGLFGAIAPVCPAWVELGCVKRSRKSRAAGGEGERREAREEIAFARGVSIHAEQGGLYAYVKIVCFRFIHRHADFVRWACFGGRRRLRFAARLGGAESALSGSITPAALGPTSNGGLGFNMWGVIVDNSGIVCAVAFSGGDYTSQWLGSRVIAAQKANTGNLFSLGSGSTPSTSLFGTNGLALSSANLFSAVQPAAASMGCSTAIPSTPTSPTATSCCNFCLRSAPQPSAPSDPMLASASVASTCSAAVSRSI